MNDLKKLLDAVIEMRAAQKLEWAALPGNFDRFKRARQQGNVARSEEKVDALIQELLRVSRGANEKEKKT